MRTFILHNLGDVSDTNMISATSTILFLWLVQMFHLVAVGVVSSLVAGILGGKVGDVVAGVVVCVVAGEDYGIANDKVNEESISN